MNLKSRKPTGLPAHWRRGRLLAAVVALGACALLTYSLRKVGRADRLDGWWLRARFSFREKLQGVPSPDPDIVLVDVDDKTSAKWKNEPIILWGPHYAAAMDRITKGGARLIALDFLPNVSLQQLFSDSDPKQKAAHDLFAQRDDAFAAALAAAPDLVMVKEAVPALPGQPPAWEVPAPELLYSARNNAPATMQKDGMPDPEWLLGFPEFPAKDNVVTGVVPTLADIEKPETSFAARIAEHVMHGRGSISNHIWSVAGKVEVPLRNDDTLLINYHNFTLSADSIGRMKSEAFQHYSLSDIAEPATTPDDRFKNKIVIIGGTYKELNDNHYIPFLEGLSGARLVSGPQIQANFVRTLLSGNPIREPATRGTWLLSVLLGLIGMLAFSRFRWVNAALTTILVALAWIGASFWLFAGRDFALPIDLPLIGLVCAAAIMGGYRALGEERERQQVMGLWGRYQNPRLVDYMLAHPEARGGEGKESEVTVLFADLKNFTKTVEKLTPEEALKVLNRYLALMTDIIQDEYGGIVDKYLGDGLMAEWGMPDKENPARPGEDNATSAVKACQELERRARELTKTIAGNQDVTFGLRLTLHTGPVVVGWVGASRIELTIIGDTVNVTSRLQETAKQLDAEFLISESTYAAVRDWVTVGQTADVEIRGRQQPLRVYEILPSESAKS